MSRHPPFPQEGIPGLGMVHEVGRERDGGREGLVTQMERKH